MQSKQLLCRTMLNSFGILVAGTLSIQAAAAASNDIIHDAEHYILAAQHGDKWMTEDKDIDVGARLSLLTGLSSFFDGWPYVEMR